MCQKRVQPSICFQHLPGNRPDGLPVQGKCSVKMEPPLHVCFALETQPEPEGGLVLILSLGHRHTRDRQ